MRRLVTLAILCAVVVPLPLSATRVLRLSLAEIRDRAAAVVVVDVIASSVRVGRSAMVWTDYHVRVVDVLRGEHHAGQVMTLSFAGGRTAGLDVGIAGVPKLENGARYAIFLDPGAGRPTPLVGWGQGLFLVAGGQLIAADGERLGIHREGTIARTRAAPRIETRLRLADPLVLNADGTTAAQTEQRSSGPTMLVRPATLDDLRRFVRGTLPEWNQETQSR